MRVMEGTYRRLLRRVIIDICILAFLADVVTGIQTPIFPLYATGMGASLGLLGFIASAFGLTRLLSSVPLGLLSDRLERRTVLSLGMLVFGLSFLAYGAAPSPVWLVPSRVLQGLAMVATFPLGVAYIGDVVERRDRSAAIGIYTAAMGSGFAVGPLLGTWMTAAAGYRSAYLLGAGIAFLGAVHAATRLLMRPVVPTRSDAPARFLVRLEFRSLLRSRGLVMACLSNVLMTLSMSGAIFTYFPVYARSAGLGTITIGSLFAWRALASAMGRVPMGALANRFSPFWLMVVVLAGEAAIDFLIAENRSQLTLTILLVLEGVGFGIFLVTGQSAVAAASGERNRGAAVGLFWMAGAVGEIVGPIGLGLIAQSRGVVWVFDVVAFTILAGTAVVVVVGVAAALRPDPAAGALPADSGTRSG